MTSQLSSGVKDTGDDDLIVPDFENDVDTAFEADDPEARTNVAAIRAAIGKVPKLSTEQPNAADVASRDTLTGLLADPRLEFGHIQDRIASVADRV